MHAARIAEFFRSFSGTMDDKRNHQIYDDAYRFGSRAAASERCRQWSGMEPDLRGDRKAIHPGSAWDRIRNAVGYGAERAPPRFIMNVVKGEGGVVVVSSCKDWGNPQCHESVTQGALARKLAAIKGYEFAGEFDAAQAYSAPVYFVPAVTMVGGDTAQRMGVRGEHDLFGGLVPFAFVATKVLTHPLPEPHSVAPPGWSSVFASKAREAVLPGYSAFSIEDARGAALRLLRIGPVRIKKPSGIGGLGQSVVTDAAQLEIELAAFDPGELAREGVVVEQNLVDVVTHSVGQVRVGELLATYYGTQHLTRNHQGEEVYGGSDLVVVRGDFDALLCREIDDELRIAIAQACAYHGAAIASYPGMFASRSNYDIAQGRDAQGRWHSGVLEQSWRIGGASGAELAALEAFQADPALKVVAASTAEIYEEKPALPADACVYFQGVDQQVGPLTKYARCEVHANP
jgi:hypothetical protein